MASIKKTIAVAQKYVGYAESAHQNNIFGKWYGANFSPWCACFVSYVLNKSGAGKLIKGAQTDKGFNSCGAGIKFFKAKKAWHPVVEAKAGDLAFFDWDGDNIQDHVGLVLANNVKGKQILTIEGNTSDVSHANGGTVQVRWRNYSVIMGVGRPAYDKE
jgi:cell wall-associated NlpC family hydrolase